MPNKYLHINEQSAWDDAAEQLNKAPQLALDTERNGRFAYKERICLIQICDGLETYLVDPLAVKDLSALGRLLADESVVKVMHGCEEDIRYFDGDYEFPVCNVFDTGLAARFLGSNRPNLGAVLEEFAGVVIPKDPRLQVSHWGLRPLPGPALDYAASDVHHLLPLADELRYRLDKCGRSQWVREECERLESLRQPPLEPLETAFRRIRGWDTLNPRQAAVLQELFAFRDGKACLWDIPPTQAASNDDLLHLAESLGRNERRLGGLLSQRCYGELQDAISQGMINPEIPKPDRASRSNDVWTSASRNRLKILKAWRAEIADDLDLAVSHVWPTPSLERLSLHPETFNDELHDSREIRQWQREEFAAQLTQVVQSTQWQLLGRAQPDD